MSMSRLLPTAALLRLENMRIYNSLIFNQYSKFGSERCMLTNKIIMLGLTTELPKNEHLHDDHLCYLRGRH